MLDVTFDAELDAFSDDLRELAVAVGKPYAEIIRRNARLIAVNLALQTQPFGAGKEGRAQGEAAVLRDIRKVYAPPSSVYGQIRAFKSDGNRTGEQLAKAFYARLMRGDYAGAQMILRAVGILTPLGKFDGGGAHQSRRGSRGRVGRGGPSLLVVDPRKLDKYSREIVRHVGMAKSGWADAARGVGGTRGIPQWVTRHRGHGEADDQAQSLNDPHVMLRNKVPWLPSVLTQAQMIEALRIQREKMAEHIDRVTTYLARKHLAAA